MTDKVFKTKEQTVYSIGSKLFTTRQKAVWYVTTQDTLFSADIKEMILDDFTTQGD